MSRPITLLAGMHGVAVCALALAGCHSTAPSPAVLPLVNSAAAAPTTIRFVDTTDVAGLTYRWTIAGKRPINLLQGIGNGCAFLDYDNDSNLDILLIGPKLALYRGDGEGHFTDVTHDTGMDTLHGSFLGCAVGDYDNDGYEDIYISAYRGGALLHNEHGKRFVDASKAAGITAQPWGTSAAFVDIDNDGKLDLYVGDYVQFGTESRQLCTIAGHLTACPPRDYAPLTGALFRNAGNGRFTEATRSWNAQDVSGRTLGVAAADFDGSGNQALMIANDEKAGNLLKSDGKRYQDIGASSGTAFQANGDLYGGMGADWGDYDGDGRMDLAVATFQHEVKSIFHNDGGGLFSDRAAALGSALPTMSFVAFGIKWLDADNDGWLDLMIANGHINDNIAEIDTSATYREPTQLFQNGAGKRLADISMAALTGSAGRPIVGRGLAIGDYDNDGKIDALVVDSEGKPLLLHNETPSAGHWLELTLVGKHGNRDGQGAVITAELAADRRLVRQCTTGGSYLSASDKRVHFGLGSATVVPALTVRWPGGHSDTYKDIAADQRLIVTEGAAAPVRTP